MAADAAVRQAERRAVAKALGLGLPARVERVRFGEYRVPSTSRAGRVYRVTVDGAGAYTCECASAHRPACVHRAALFVRRLEANSGVRVTGVETEDGRRRLGNAPGDQATGAEGVAGERGARPPRSPRSFR